MYYKYINELLNLPEIQIVNIETNENHARIEVTPGKFLPGGSIRGGLIVGSVGFICFLAVFSYGYYLKKKRYDEHKE
ncbi:hypothetical protein CAI16_08625 [Virgibacillus dokdonensis]|uniref:Uncharacterized protein n=1 Tax=Virgibacillus dokdonensis TaxID=302167 RepID=A0A3E0WSD2_9BACI|nr:hypothetical protein [Virgibacillus dokdonensis]RFA35299.1 hypothetical protein CAI16_08625 [Virgibacillus dokdonensis]